jgi:alpha-galactosidase
MKTRIGLGFLALSCFLSATSVQAVAPNRAEIDQARQWMAARFDAGKETNDVGSFFSFSYAGKPSAELLKTWESKRTTRELDDKRTERTLAFTDPKTGLTVRCVGVEYRDFPTVEWTLHFKNTGKADTPIIADVQAIDAAFVRAGDGEFTLHSIKGDTCSAESFQPYLELLGPKALKRLAPGGGRPTNGAAPYWNFETAGQGFIVALGWPGQWAARFDRDDGKTLRIRAGQELTHFKLHPGEEVRSPLVALQFYRGDWIRGQNLWRRWMVAHNIPRPGGKLVPTHYGACWSNDLHPRGDTEMAVLKGYIREKIPLKFYFIDAGWYPSKRDWWTDAGTWQVDKERFPKGIREISDIAHANGMQFVLWFEPERAGPGSWLAENHPEWIHGGKNGGLVNMGNHDAWKWIVDRIDSLIKSEGVDVYRQDFNIEPLGYWRGADAPDRQGITENGHVSGYLAYWDELVRRNPKLWIDTCASGGRRNDLETLRRSVPLLRSDCFGAPTTTRSDDLGEPTIQQCQTYGLSLWVPYHGSGTLFSTKYWFRSTIFPASRIGWDTRKKDLDYPFLRRMIAEFHKVEPYLLGDYYPLTPYNLEKTAWIGWQFDEPELGGGAVQAFRREDAKDDSHVLKLQGLDADAVYAVENLDDGKIETLAGKTLMDAGLPVKLAEKPGAALFVYRKVK